MTHEPMQIKDTGLCGQQHAAVSKPSRLRRARFGVRWLAILTVLLAMTHNALAAPEANPPFKVQGRSALLGDIDSGALLFTQNVDLRLEPASLTKIMTLYLVYEALANGQLEMDTQLPVSEKAWRMVGSRTFLEVGKTVRVEDLLMGIAVQSGNDACVVVAEHLGGSEAGFATMMNEKARALGLTQTHFVNSTGMPDPDHYTTARDLFLLTRAFVGNFPQFSHFPREKQFTYNKISQYNRNRLLWRDPSITGLKTGHTQSAGYGLVATNEKEGQRLVAIVMGAKKSKIREEEALRLLRYGNRMYETVRLFEAKGVVRKLRVWKGDVDHLDVSVREPLLVTVKRKERGSLDVGLLYDEPLMAPIAANDQVGTVIVKLGDKEILSMPVVAATSVGRGGIFRTVVDSLRLYLGW